MNQVLPGEPEHAGQCIGGSCLIDSAELKEIDRAGNKFNGTYDDDKLQSTPDYITIKDQMKQMSPQGQQNQGQQQQQQQQQQHGLTGTSQTRTGRLGEDALQKIQNDRSSIGQGTPQVGGQYQFANQGQGQYYPSPQQLQGQSGAQMMNPQYQQQQAPMVQYQQPPLMQMIQGQQYNQGQYNQPPMMYNQPPMISLGQRQ